MNAQLIELPVAQTTSIATAAMLVDLSIRKWTGRKTDKAASEEVTSDKGAKRGTAQVKKCLLSDCDELVAIIKLDGHIRSTHYSMTLPWTDSGMRLLPTTKYADYVQAMSTLTPQFHKLVNEFLDSYEWEIAKAEASLGDLFNRDDYPTRSTIASRFGVSIGYIPVPESGDWRVDIGAAGVGQLKSQYESYYTNKLTQAMTDIWQRAAKVLENMSERLDFADGATRKRFHDTLVTNVLEVVDLMADCNLTGDPAMRAAEARLRRALSGVDADDLRKDHNLRIRTKAEVDAVLASLPGLGI
jgi:hypothetical protein